MVVCTVLPRPRPRRVCWRRLWPL